MSVFVFERIITSLVGLHVMCYCISKKTTAKWPYQYKCELKESAEIEMFPLNCTFTVIISMEGNFTIIR